MKSVKQKAAAGLLALVLVLVPWAVALADDEETEELEQQLESLRQQAEMQQEETARIQGRIDTVPRREARFRHGGGQDRREPSAARENGGRVSG